MEITIKIDFNEENMKKLADIFWAPIIAKIDEEDKTTEEVAHIDLEPKVVAQEDDFAHKYKHLEIERRLVTPRNIEDADRLLSLVYKNGGTDEEIKRASEFALAIRADGFTVDDLIEAEDKYRIKALWRKYSRPTQKAEPTKPIKEWSEFPEMFSQRVKDSPLSIAEIADKLRVGQACIYNWKRGSNIPCPPHLGRLCYLFNWDRDYMLKLREEAVTK